MGRNEILYDPILSSSDAVHMDSRSKTGTFEALITSIGATPVVLLINQQESIVDDLIIPDTIVLKFTSNGSFTVAASKTLTIQSLNIEASLRQIFFGGGAYDFVSGAVLNSSWFGSFADAVGHIGNVNNTILICTENYTLTGNLTINSNITLMVTAGNMLITSGNDLIINGRIDATLNQLFSGAGVDLSDAAITECYPEWWGGLGDGNFDNTDAVNYGIISGKKVTFGDGLTYYCIGSLQLISNCYINIGNAIIEYNGTNWAIDNPNKLVDASASIVENITINCAAGGKINITDSISDGCIDFTAVINSNIINPTIIGYSSTKGARRGIGIRCSEGVSNTVLGHKNTISNPKIKYFASGVRIIDGADYTTVINSIIEQCDDYGLYNTTTGTKLLGGYFAIDGDNASGANIYFNNTNAYGTGIIINDPTGIGYGIRLGTSALGHNINCSIEACGGTDIHRETEWGIFNNYYTVTAKSVQAESMLVDDGIKVAGKGVLSWDSSSGRVIRFSRIVIEDGAVASTIDVSMDQGPYSYDGNGDTVTKRVNLVKGGNHTDYALNAAGTMLTIKSGGTFSGTPIFAVVLNLDFGVDEIYPYINAPGTHLNVYVHNTVGVAVDLTTLADFGTFAFNVLYITYE